MKIDVVDGEEYWIAESIEDLRGFHRVYLDYTHKDDVLCLDAILFTSDEYKAGKLLCSKSLFLQMLHLSEKSERISKIISALESLS